MRELCPFFVLGIVELRVSVTPGRAHFCTAQVSFCKVRLGTLKMAEGQQQAFVVFRRAILEEGIEEQVAAINKLPTVILAAGRDVTLESIFPLLREYIPNGDDEVLLGVAKGLDLKGDGAPCADILGTTDSQNCWAEILEILEKLCAVEETVVRDQAVDSILHTLDFLSPSASIASILPVLDRLSQNEWFTARVSACRLLPSVLKKSDSNEASLSLLQLFIRFCDDETPMVRRAIARVFAEFAEVAAAIADTGKEMLVTDIVPKFKHLGMHDDAASVQHIIAESAKRVAALLSADEFTSLFLDYVRWCSESPSWRLRSIIAGQFGAFCKVLDDPAASAGVLLPLFLGLLVDPERDVRADACRGAVELHAGVGHNAFVEGVVPKLGRCIKDDSHVVRNAYAESCSDIIVALDEGDRSASSGGEGINTLVVDTFLLLQDDNPEVRAKIMSAIQRLTDRSSTSPEGGLLEERFLPLLQGVAGDNDWRVRAAFTSQLPSLAKALGQALFQQHFFPAFRNLIDDEVAAVRASTVEAIVELADQLDESWLHKVFLPSLFEKLGATESRNADQCVPWLCP